MERKGIPYDHKKYAESEADRRKRRKGSIEGDLERARDAGMSYGQYMAMRWLESQRPEWVEVWKGDLNMNVKKLKRIALGLLERCETLEASRIEATSDNIAEDIVAMELKARRVKAEIEEAAEAPGIQGTLGDIAVDVASLKRDVCRIQSWIEGIRANESSAEGRHE